MIKWFTIPLILLCLVSSASAYDTNMSPEIYRSYGRQQQKAKDNKWAENVYNTVVVIDHFIASQPEIEECYNLAPVIKHLRREADLLNAFFIDHEEELENKLCLIFIQILFKRCSKNCVLE